MRLRKHFVPVVGIASSFLAGCGGIKEASCPDGNCRQECTGEHYVAGGVCLPLTVCEPGWYVVEEPTPTSDRVCDLCPSATFTTLANSVACTPWRPCPPGTYVSNVPSVVTDRICSTCMPGTYTSGANQSACLGAADCPAGTIETAPGTDTTPRACAPCSSGEYCAGGKAPATACTGEKWDNDGAPSTDCVPKTVCAPGTSILRLGSATTDRACVTCGGGTFSTSENAGLCTPWSSCAAGTYVANTPSPSTDRWCAPCPPETFTSGENQSACRSVDDCPAGTVETKPGTTTSAPECAPCQPGQHCAGGSAPAAPCADETWDHDGDPATACIGWTHCLPGSRIASVGGPTADQICVPCPDGTAAPAPDLHLCMPWSTCPRGSYVVIQPSAQVDRTCAACSGSTFTSEENQNACEPWSTCPANTTFVSAPGTPWTDVVCSPCQDNGCPAYCTPEGTCRECVDYTDCAAGLSCVDGACTDLGCSGPDAYFVETFASGPLAQWWTLTGEWDVAPAAGTGNPGDDPANDHTEPGDDDMLAGVAIPGTPAPAVMSQAAHLTSAPFDISTGPSPVYLEFYRWLNSDVSPRMTNTVEVWDGSLWIEIWSGPNTTPLAENAWSQQVFDVTAYRNPYFRVRFGYAIDDEAAASSSSWNIDDVRVASTFTCGGVPTP